MCEVGHQCIASFGCAYPLDMCSLLWDYGKLPKVFSDCCCTDAIKIWAMSLCPSLEHTGPEMQHPQEGRQQQAAQRGHLPLDGWTSFSCSSLFCSQLSDRA